MRLGLSGSRLTLVALVASSLALVVEPADAWTVEEHRLLADSALAGALAGWPAPEAEAIRAAASPQRGPAPAAFLDRLGFGALCAWSARDDGAMARRHERGRTVLEQLRPLSAARLDSLARNAKCCDSLLFSPDGRRAAARLRRLESANPIACFLQHHLTALRLAAAAGGPRRGSAAGAAPAALLRRALIYEAIAQGYLADAFAAGHLMTPAGARPTGFDPVNLRRAHDEYDNLGAYVLNARGETWQTFGDWLLLWYGPSFAHVYEASVTSLRELLLLYADGGGVSLPGPLRAWADSVAGAQGSSPERLAAAWNGSGEGPEYLVTTRLPSLMLIPTPVVATWSVRTDALDEHRMRKRRHFPQLAERGGHDPTLDPQDLERLPARAAVPPWMIPDTLFRMDPMNLIRRHPDFASVRFAQAAEPPPSYAGVLVLAGAVRYDDASGGGTDHVLGLGFSPLGESPLLIDRLSLDILLLTPEHGGRPRSGMIRLGASPALPHFGIWRQRSLRWLDRVRFETGRAWTRGARPAAGGNHYALGLESPTIPLRFAFVGLTLRLGYQWTSLDRPRRGATVGMVLQ
jgi:hypothetical protein